MGHDRGRCSAMQRECVSEGHGDLPWRESHFLTFASATSSFSKIGVSRLIAVIFPVVASTHTSVSSFLPGCLTSTDQISTPFSFSSSTQLIAPPLTLASAIFSLMLRDVRLYKQFRFTFLSP